MTTRRETLAMLAPLFSYPEPAYEEHRQRVMTTGSGPEESRPHAAHLGRFAEEIARLDISDLQALYTSTFDLAPSCSPYLGIHLFGEEGRERARLMVGLRLAYRRIGEERYGELPDHVAEVLRFAPQFADDEWVELQTLVLTPALTTMHALVNDSGNPYRHLIAAALTLLRQRTPLEIRERSRIEAFEPASQGGRP